MVLRFNSMYQTLCEVSVILINEETTLIPLSVSVRSVHTLNPIDVLQGFMQNANNHFLGGIGGQVLYYYILYSINHLFTNLLTVA